MPTNKRSAPAFPQVRNAFGMDITRQDYLWITGLSDGEDSLGFGCIMQGEWSNNWVLYPDSFPEALPEEKIVRQKR